MTDQIPEGLSSVEERHRLFRRMAWGCLAMIALLFVAAVYWMSGPDAYHESLSQQQAEAPHWPDGSVRTDNDWWADPSRTAPSGGEEAPPAGAESPK